MAPDIPENSREYRSWGQLNIEFYKHICELRNRIPQDQLLLIRYEDLVKQSEQTVYDIYSHFGWKVNPEFQMRLKEAAAASRKYEVGHWYTLEQFGYSRVQIDIELKEVFDVFDFGQREIRQAAIPS